MCEAQFEKTHASFRLLPTVLVRVFQMLHYIRRIKLHMTHIILCIILYMSNIPINLFMYNGHGISIPRNFTYEGIKINNRIL
jgi:hypothetical protein